MTTAPYGLHEPVPGEAGATWRGPVSDNFQTINDAFLSIGHHVDAYEAVGDGTTDDTDAFNDTLTASGWPLVPAHIVLGHKRYVIDGTWLFDGAGGTSTPPVVVSGNGAEIYTEQESTSPMISVTNSLVSTTFVTLKDLSLIPNCSSSPYRKALLLNNAEHTKLQRVLFGGSFGLGVEFTGNCTYTNFDVCFFTSLARGVLFTGNGEHTSFTGCHFAEQLAGNPLNWIQSANGGNPTGQVSINACSFRGAGATLPIINIANGFGWQIVGNKFFDCDQEAIWIGANGEASGNVVAANSFYLGKRSDVYINGGRKNIVSGNRLGRREGSVAADTFAAIRVKNLFGGAAGHGNVISNNVSEDTASAITYVVELDGGCDYCVVTGNIGLAGVLAAGANNVVTGNPVN